MQQLALVPRRPKNRRNLLAIGDVPDYLKDNPNVLGGYRSEMSLQQALRTIFMWHNETMNIWSHLIAAACFMAFIVQSVYAGFRDTWPLIVFELGAAYAFAISATFHTVMCISKQYYDTWRKIDFTAVVVVMFSMFWPFCYYIFDRTRFIAYVSVAAGLSIMCIVTCLLPVFQTNSFHTRRPMVFGVLGVWGIMPIAHAAILYWRVYAVRAAVILSATQLTIHSVGAVFYGTQFPERMIAAPPGGSYRVYRHADYFTSHFIFHVLIFMGMVAFHEGNRILISWFYSGKGMVLHRIFPTEDPINQTRSSIALNGSG